MKAIVYTEYGPPEVLQLQEIEKPAPGDNEVLIKVHTSSVTSGDCNIRGFTFVPASFKLPARLMFGIRKPRNHILGVEFAGAIEAIGKDVTRFKVGDEVVGISGARMGSYAEYNVLPEDADLLIKPASLTFEEAVAIPNGALTAYTFLKNMAAIQPGQKVLINGASGSVGSAAVQLAKFYGAEVTGVCSTRNIELVKSLGANHVIDYTKEDFTRSNKSYDIIFDTVGKTSFAACKHRLTKNGQFLAGSGGLGVFWQMLWTSLFSSKKVKAGVSSESKDILQVILELTEKGNFKPVIDRSYPLEEIVEAHRYVDSGRKRGNVVITVQ
jgi:NADPH:quinone reductase-like Zn-dependent oxidoreductase